MTDRFVAALWRVAVLGLIFITGFAALFLGYRMMLDLIDGSVSTALAPMAGAVLSGAASLLLCRSRNDLLWV
jgi:hypothetical protein